mgnify:FL=1
MSVAVSFLAVPIITIIAVLMWRWTDIYLERKTWRQITEASAEKNEVFESSMLDGLPEPARRYFLYMIKPGTELNSVVEIWMTGEMGLGNKQNPKYGPMRGHQILAPPCGLVWRMMSKQGAVRISGSDGFCKTRSWTRFWLFGLVPIVRVGGGVDHARSAFGRVAAEAAFWAPAALLPHKGATWESLGENTARVTIHCFEFRQAVDVTVDTMGRPVMVTLDRWSNANSDHIYRLQPFGGYLSNFKEFSGFKLPTYVEGGNFIGQEAYFPFYKANVVDLRILSGQ